jgi:RNA polymerase subunit RPABC4/transcription elongation factor Spt4
MSGLRSVQILVSSIIFVLMLLLSNVLYSLFYPVLALGLNVSFQIWFSIIITIITGISFLISIANKGNIVCLKCSTINKLGQKFCSKCGEPLISNTRVSQHQENVCSKCGQQLKGESFCPSCGTKTN